MKKIRSFLVDESGGPAAEFALVLPVMLMFLLGIIDVGRYMWEYNRAEKATQMGARFAVATDVVAAGLNDYSFVLECSVAQGSSVSSTQFDKALCSSTQCTITASCAGIPTGSDNDAYNSTAFGNIVDRMQTIKPDILPSQVTILYKNSGLGYAGDPNSIDVSPIVTVAVTGLTFQPITTILFDQAMVMGPFSYSLTLEDGVGTTTPN